MKIVTQLDSFWPLLVISIAMIVAAVIDGWKLKVPNAVTFPMILSGWLLAIAYGLGWLAPAPGTPPIESAWERLQGSLVVTLVALVTLGITWVFGLMGAGDVKMQMGYGAWIGAFFGQGTGLHVFTWGLLVGMLVGGVLGLIMMAIYRQWSKGLANIRDASFDISTLSIKEVQDRAQERKKGQKLLPYGIPLCIGFLGYLFYFMQ